MSSNAASTRVPGATNRMPVHEPVVTMSPRRSPPLRAVDLERNLLRRSLERLRQCNTVADNERAVALEVREQGQRVDPVQIDEARIHDLDGCVHGRHGCLQVGYAIRLRTRG